MPSQLGHRYEHPSEHSLDPPGKLPQPHKRAMPDFLSLHSNRRSNVPEVLIAGKRVG